MSDLARLMLLVVGGLPVAFIVGFAVSFWSNRDAYPRELVRMSVRIGLLASLMWALFCAISIGVPAVGLWLETASE